MLGLDGAATLAWHEAHGQHVVAAGAGREAAGDDRAGLGREGEQTEQDPGLVLVEHAVMRAVAEQGTGGGALGGALLGLAAGECGLHGGVVPGRLRDAGRGCLAALEQRDRDVHAGRVPPGRAGGELVGVVVRAAEVAGRAEVERGRHERVRGRLVWGGEHPLGEVAELRGAVHPAALRLGDLPEQRDDGGDGGAGGRAQALGAGLPRVSRARVPGDRVFGEPGAQRRPAAAPVVALVGAGEERPVVGAGGEGEHRAVTGSTEPEARAPSASSPAPAASTAAMAVASLGR